MIYLQNFHSPFGCIEIVADEEALLQVHLVRELKNEVPNAVTMLTTQWLREYFAKKEPSWRPPLRFSTPFTQRVSEEVMELGFGEVASYSQIAKRIDKPKAARAVGQVMKKNPYMIIVPCHRVVAKGGLGGYNGGIEIKKQLLEFERENR